MAKKKPRALIVAQYLAASRCTKVLPGQGIDVVGDEPTAAIAKRNIDVAAGEHPTRPLLLGGTAPGYSFFICFLYNSGNGSTAGTAASSFSRAGRIS
jgi:hypothetical protein